MKSRLAANALLNVLAGASGALFAFIVPVLLASRISAIELSIWSVILQSAVYVTPFALGIQGVLARHVALHAERQDGQGLHRTMQAAFRVLGVAALAYTALGLGVALLLGELYPAIPHERLSEARLALLAFLVGQASMIPAAALAGYFFGIQRNLAITLNVLGSKTLASIGIVALSDQSSLVLLALVASAITVGGNLWLFAAYRRSAGGGFKLAVPAMSASWADCLRMVRECAPISLWTLATFVIYGGTSTVASTTDFANFPAYSMAAAATLVLMGFHGAAMTPLIPHMALVQERGGPAAVAHSLARASMWSAGISAIVLLAYAVVGPVIVEAIIPGQLALVTTSLMPVLLCGNVIRLLGLPYANTLVGLGLQGRILWTPVLEAGATFGAAWWLGPRFGLPGVAASIAVGGVVSILVHLLINMPLTREIVPVQRLRLCLQALLILSPATVVLYLLRVVGPH